MSFSSEYIEYKKKKKQREEQQKLLQKQLNQQKLPKKAATQNKDIGPVPKKEQGDWVSAGLFDDGYQFGDILRTIGGTALDLVGNVAGGALEIGEGVVDAAAYIVGGVGELFGAKDFAKDTKKFIANDLYNGEEVANRILSLGLVGAGGHDEASLLGEKLDSIAQSGGQLAGNLAITAATGGGVPWWLTTGVTSFGQATQEAFNEGADYAQAGASGLISAGAEILTEKLFGGSGLREKGLFNLDGLTKGISNKFVKAVLDLGVDMAAEGTEEFFSSVISKFGDAIVKEKNPFELITDEKAIEEYIDSFVGGAILGGVMNAGKVNKARAKNGGRDYRTGLTATEEKVFNKAYEAAISDRSKGGKELTKKEKAEIYDGVMDDLRKGRVSTGAIEKILGGESYKAYKDAVDKDNATIKELQGLYEGKELEQKIKDILDNSGRNELKKKLSDEVFGLAKEEGSKMKDRGSFLAESYYEQERGSQKFEADLSQYDEKYRKTVQKAIDSGILNNKRSTHEMVDLFAKLSADKGVEIDFTDNEKIKGTSFAVEGKTVNGYVDKDGNITVNVESPKYLNSIVGHEITHILEGTDLYEALQKEITTYAESKGEYNDRLRAAISIYEGVDGYKGTEGYEKIKREVVSDLVGDYLFTDADFVRNLHTNNRNLFQKIYDEIKYLCKIATAGSKEARQLESVKRAFEKAYQDGSKATGEVKHSLIGTNKDGIEVYETSKSVMDLTWDERKAKYLDVMRSEYRGRTARFKRNGHFYYAEFDQKSIKKPIYGDKRSSPNGVKALIKAGADGDIFDLVENSQYDGSKGNTKNHTKADYFDYFVKTVQIDGKVFDLVADVEKGYGDGGGYVYTLALVDNKTIKASPATGPSQSEPFQNAGNAFVDGSIPQDVKSVKRKFSLSSEQDINDTKQKQLEIINATNPAWSDQLTWIRTVDDIKTFEEVASALDFEEYGDKITPDYTREDLETAIKTGKITVYSSYPIKNGVFVTPSRMEAQNYAGDGNVYSKKVNLTDVAWIDAFEGQYAEVSTSDPDIRYSLSQKPIDEYTKTQYNAFGWARYAGAISKNELDDMYSKIQKKPSLKEIKQSSRGEAIIEVNNKHNTTLATNNVFVFVTGAKDDPQITRVLRANLFDEASIDIVRKDIYENTDHRALETYARVMGEEIIQYYNRGNCATFGEYSNRSRAQRSGNEGENAASVNRSRNQRSGAVAETKSNEIAPYQEASSADGVFFDGQERKYSLSDIGPVREDITPTNERKEDIKTIDKKQHEDRLSRSIKRIDKMFEYDKAELDEEFQIRRDDLQAEFGDKDSFVARRAMELYTELNKLKKGVRASEALGHLLDYGYPWQNVKMALLNANRNPARTVDQNSAMESIVREALNEEYENGMYEFDELENEYKKRLKELEKGAEAKRKNAKTANQRRKKQNELFEKVKAVVGDTSTWVDKKLGLSYKTNTLRRNLRDVVRDENGNRDIQKADAIYEWLQGKYNQNEASLNRESNRIKKVFADMKITDAESTYIQMLGEFRHNPETTLTEERVKEFLEENKGSIDEAKVDKAIELARETYDSLLLRVNEVLRENGMKEIPYRKGYFPHFTEEKQGVLAKLFNWKTQNNDIPTDIAGITEQFNPNRSWQSFNKQRKGDTTDYNFLKGMDSYVFGALDWIYHIEDIQNRRALENYIRYTHSEKGVKEKIDAIQANDELDADEMQEQIDLVYKEAGNPLNNFVTDLRAGTNKLANKKSSLDRGMEEMVNRKVYSTMTNLSNRVSANMVGGSISSALTNFIPITQSWAEVSPISSLRAMLDTIKSSVHDDGMVGKSAFLTNRINSSENLYKTTWDKIGDKIGWLMEGIDSFTAQTVWRSKYLENVSNGMSESQAIANADQFAENVIAGRSRGNMPTIFDSKNPLVKTLTAFQLEVNNQYGYMFKDMPQDIKNESVGKLVKGYATMFLGAYVFNALFSSLTGRDAAFDPVGIVEDLLRDLGLFGEDDEEEPTDALMGLTENIMQELPFVGGLLGGGRVPISSALPFDGDIMGMLEASGKAAESGNYQSLTKEWLKPLYYLAMPMGGGQLKKSIEGLSMFDNSLPVAGSYTDSGDLRFPVEDTLGNRIQAGLFGQWANANAREYFEGGHKPLSEKQTQEYLELGAPISDYWEYREKISSLDTISEKADYINSLSIPTEKKNLLINNISNRQNPIDMSNYDLFGNFEEFEMYNKNPELYSFLQGIGVSYEDYAAASNEEKEVYQWAANNQDQYTLSKAVTNDLVQYKNIVSSLNQIKADQDKNGKTISGSRKQKVLKYINSLGLSDGQRDILYKLQYPSDDTYDSKIISYIRNKKDFTREEQKYILEQLGYTLSNNGTVKKKR